MASSPDNVSMALFCDFENVALGVRDAKYDKFDIKRVLERLLLKGSIVVKKAYCDWDRYKGFKAAMHEANFELIEIPHVRQSGKNSADIRLVVDALDLCYTKAHVNTFVIISGDSDFSPLVSKLRENAKQVIGVGVKQSTSDLLIANCDEFIFYDDLVRESQRAANKRDARDAQPAARRSPAEDSARREEIEKRRNQAIEIAVETFEALLAERGDSGKIWASMLKEAIKRRKPDFSESYYGFRAFGNLLEEAQSRGLLEFGRDEKSGAYVYRSSGVTAEREPVEAQKPMREARPSRRNRGGSRAAKDEAVSERPAIEPADQPGIDLAPAAVVDFIPGSDGGAPASEAHDIAPEAWLPDSEKTAAMPTDEAEEKPKKTARQRSGTGKRTSARKKSAAVTEAETTAANPGETAVDTVEPIKSETASTEPIEDSAAAKKPRKSPARNRRPRKKDAEST